MNGVAAQAWFSFAATFDKGEKDHEKLHDTLSIIEKRELAVRLFITKGEKSPCTLSHLNNL